MDWEVTNKSILNTAFTKHFGKEIYKDFYTLERDLDPGANLYYNENAAFAEENMDGFLF